MPRDRPGGGGLNVNLHSQELIQNRIKCNQGWSDEDCFFFAKFVSVPDRLGHTFLCDQICIGKIKIST